MNFLFVDNRINNIELDNLKKLNKKIFKVPSCELLYPAISAHPDILMNIIDSKNILVHKNMNYDFLCLIKKSGFNVIYSNNSLCSSYPEDIILNALTLDNVLVHNLKFTDKILLDLNKHKKLIHVKQGYTKCSIAVVDNNSIITSDVSIAKILSKENFNVLLLPPGDIILEGLNYGFIGGTCGLVEDKVLAFYGSLEHYVYGKEVLNFLKEHKVEPLFLRDGKLVDRGSILSI